MLHIICLCLGEGVGKGPGHLAAATLPLFISVIMDYSLTLYWQANVGQPLKCEQAGKQEELGGNLLMTCTDPL